MKNRHWWNPQGEGDEHKDRQLDRCDDVAHLLTALFDGEANEEEARRARLHLLACQRCAELFANWSQTRNLLRSEAVPAPPPTLLWRVILACRLAAFTRKPTRPVVEKKQPSVRVHDDLAPAPPSYLMDSILASTVGETTRRQAPEVPRWRRNPGAWTALAAPAVAMWLLAMAWRPVDVVPITPSQSADSAPLVARQGKEVSARRVAVVSRAATAASEAKASESADHVRPHAAPVLDMTTEAAPVVRTRVVTVAREDSPAPVRRWSAAIYREAAAPAEEERAKPETRPEAAEVRSAAVVSTPARPAVTLALATSSPAPVALSRPSVAPPSVRLASLADTETAPPPARRASFRPLAKSAIVRLAKAAGTMRASTPVEPVSTPLVLASTGDPEHGLDEVQSTVEDLRALLASDSNLDNMGTDMPS